MAKEKKNGKIVKKRYGRAKRSLQLRLRIYRYRRGCHVGFYVDWDEKRDFRKDLGYWIKMVDAEVVGNIHDKSEQQKDQRSTIIYRDFMKKGRE